MPKELVFKVSINNEELEKKFSEIEEAMDVIHKNMTWISDLCSLELTPTNAATLAGGNN